MSLTDAEASDLFRQPPSRFIQADIGEIAYRVVGSGPDVLFVHGWPVSGATFRKLLPHLVDHVTCHLVDLPGAGSSRHPAGAPLSIENHITSVRHAIDALGLTDVVVVGHDSGGMIARHAVAGDPRVRGMVLIDTEQSTGLSWRFKSFIMGRRIPGFGAALGWLAGKPRLRRNKFVLGDAFVDRSLLDGEFDEFFLQPLHSSREYRDATMQLLRSFDYRHVHELKSLHSRIDVPVTLVWGEKDAFFPVAWAREMVIDFRDAHLEVIPGAGLFSHEERPAEVAAAMLPTLTTPRHG
jgi:pimeloyl-ACP methyl ester carboxylesterase